MTGQKVVERPEHKDWKPWWLAYAEFEGKVLILADWSLAPPEQGWSYHSRYHVCTERHEGIRGGCGVSPVMFTGDSLTGAEAVFREAELRLLAGEFGDE